MLIIEEQLIEIQVLQLERNLFQDQFNLKGFEQGLLLQRFNFFIATEPLATR